MVRLITLAGVLLAGMALGALVVFIHHGGGAEAPAEIAASPPVTVPSAVDDPVRSDATDRPREIDDLLATVALAAREREMLFEQLQELALRLDGVAASVEQERLSDDGDAETQGVAASAAAVSLPLAAEQPETAMQVYLDAGLDPVQVEEIQRRQAALEMERLYLRDQAIREGWIDTDRYNERLSELQAARGDLRAELGDDAFDRYLYASDRPNRVRIQSLIDGSPAEVAGLRSGDVILSYGEQRVLVYGDLRQATSGGDAGATVQVRVQRGEARLDVFVPRGPLGVRLTSLTLEP